MLPPGTGQNAEQGRAAFEADTWWVAAAAYLQTLRQVPVIERDIWCDVCRQQGISQVAVEVQALLIHLHHMMSKEQKPHSPRQCKAPLSRQKFRKGHLGLFSGQWSGCSFSCTLPGQSVECMALKCNNRILPFSSRELQSPYISSQNATLRP